MDQRCIAYDYAFAGIYHRITLRVADALQQPLGRVVSDVRLLDGSDGATGTAPAALRGFPLRRLRLRTPRTFAQGSTDMSLNHRDGLIKPSRWVNQTITMGQTRVYITLGGTSANREAKAGEACGQSMQSLAQALARQKDYWWHSN